LRWAGRKSSVTNRRSFHSAAAAAAAEEVINVVIQSEQVGLATSEAVSTD